MLAIVTNGPSSRVRRAAAAIKRRVPPQVLDRTLLSAPRLYRTRLVNYETNLDPARVEVLVRRVLEASAVDGDVIECGSSRGGSAVIMARALRAVGRPRTVYACDSFAGFDRSELDKEREAGLTEVGDDAFTSTSLDYLKRKLAVLGLTGAVTPVAGYFQDTLPQLACRFCLVFIDCDLRDSVLYCARQLFPQLRPGGQMVFDDYDAAAWKGAGQGVSEFIEEHRAMVAEHGHECGMYWVVKSG
jgi:predicted O-methyltransferase YrrM